VAGTVTTNHVSPNPPLPAFPVITYNATAWTQAGYTIRTFSSCSAAQSFLLDPGDNSKYVVRITPACNLSVNNKVTMNVRNDIAVITDGDVNVTNKINFVSADGAFHTVYWIVPNGVGCGNINFNNAVGESHVRMFLYTPCNVTWTNSTGLIGQVFGNNVSATNSFNMSYYPITVPGYSGTPGFNVDIAYIREVSS
jgi:hypothetical protein